MRKVKFVAFLSISVLAALDGCSLDKPREIGDTCDANFILLESGKIVKPDANENMNYFFNHDVCPPESSFCRKMKNGEHFCSPFKEACFKGTHTYNGECEEDSIENCGSHDNNCMENKGWYDAECINGTCIMSACLDGYTESDNACLSANQCCGEFCKQCTNEPKKKLCAEDDCVENCANESEINCGGSCINPNISTTYCGSDENCVPNICGPQTIKGWQEGICDNGTCKATECKPGYYVYNGKCEADNNDHCGDYDQSCTTSSIKGSLTVSCEAGQCLALSCDNAHILTGNSCFPRDCIDGQIKCTDDGTTGQLYHCNNNQWIEDNTCPDNNSCNSEGTACGTCINGKTKCDNTGTTGKIYTCTSGEWPSEATRECTNSRSCNSTGTACGSCINGTTSCYDNSNNIGTVRTCNNGRLENPVSCSTVSCNSDKSNCGDCVNNATRCIDRSDIGTIETCKSGEWYWDKDDLAASCHDVSCDSTGKYFCGVCKNTTVATCQNNSDRVGQLTTCTGGKIHTTPCSNDASCDSSGLSCGTCQNRVISCKNNGNVGQLSICDYGVETNIQNCPGNTKCKNDSECLTCQEAQLSFLAPDGITCVDYNTLVSSAGIGDTLYFGRYHKMNDVGDMSPIEWQVLAVENNKILLITHQVIDAIPYNYTEEVDDWILHPEKYTEEQQAALSAEKLEKTKTTWETSTIRSWLNGLDGSHNKFSTDYSGSGKNFLDIAFTSEEKEKILEHSNTNPANTDTNTSGGNNTTDKVFLLSASELKTYFASSDFNTKDSSKAAIPTTYAKNIKGAVTCTTGDDCTLCTTDNCPTIWYTRTPGSSLFRTVYVFFDGRVDSAGYGVSESGLGIRPAMWIKK